ncbi:MAG: hypothetical protein HYZ09_01970 [Candidatus Kerfeldbacteria bacterium]|nr:hypothetical protein [Candidatus Kerfeldbacteria bacterium]
MSAGTTTTDIVVRETGSTHQAWTFNVDVYLGDDVTHHTVTLNRADYQRLSSGQEDPDVLVRRSFEFLLQRETADKILRSFNLTDISQHFPDFEPVIKGHVPPPPAPSV